MDPRTRRLLLISPLLAAAAEYESKEWFKEDYEYEYVESVTIIVLVFVSLLFETAYHQVNHRAQHSYKYGEASHGKTPHSEIAHERLGEQLFARMAEEFMVLGFLAFCVFIFNKTEAFKTVAENVLSSKDWEYPKSGHDWVEVVEQAHIQLFGAMAIYFVVEGFIVRGSIQRLQLLEQLHVRRHEVAKDFQFALPSSNLPFAFGWKDRNNNDVLYVLYRKYFIFSILQTQDTQPDLFLTIWGRLGIDDKMENAPRRLQQELETHFEFSEYLAVNCEGGVHDTIAVAVISRWGFMGAFTLMAILHGFVGFENSTLRPVFVVGILLISLLMWLLVEWLKSQICMKFPSLQERYDNSSNGSRTGDLDHATEKDVVMFRTRWQFARDILRLGQVGAMLVGYQFSRLLFRFNDWREDAIQQAILCVAFSCLAAFMCYVCQTVAADFLLLFALPPYVDDVNFEVLLYALDTQRAKTPNAVAGRSIDTE